MNRNTLFRFWCKFGCVWTLWLVIQLPLSAMQLLDPCDTLLTNAGERLLVHVESIEDGVIRFYDCGDSTRLKERWMGNIQEVRLGKAASEPSLKSNKEKERERLIKKIHRRTGSTLLLGMLSFLFWIFGLVLPPLLLLSYPLGAIALGLGAWMVWNTHGLPGLRWQRAVGIFGIVVGGLNLLSLLYWLFLLLLFL